MPEKTIKKVWNIMRKWDQNGAQMGAEIDEKSEKGEKKGMQKMMLEFDEKTCSCPCTRSSTCTRSGASPGG